MPVEPAAPIALKNPSIIDRHVPTKGRINNVPLEGNNMLTRGNLYKMTKIGERDWVGHEINGRREHIKAGKNGQQFISWEKLGSDGKWHPETKAAYIWHTNKDAIDEVATDLAARGALKEARLSGQVVDYVAARNNYDPNDIEIRPLYGDYTIDGGLIRRPDTGEIIGDHVQVTPFGVITQVGGRFNVLEADLLGEIRNVGKRTNTFARNLEEAIQSPGAHDELYNKLIGGARRAEANYRADLANRFKGFESEAKAVRKARPFGANKIDYQTDLFRYIENKFTYDDGSKQVKTIDQMFADKYGAEALRAAQRFEGYTRKLYDDVLDEVNAEYRRLGREEVPKRQDYITHLMEKETLDKLGITPEILTGIMGDMSGGNRGAIPGSIVGQSQNLKPNSRWNPFFGRRRGEASATNPFKAVETYLQAALYNKHMTEPTMQARQFEMSLRAASDTGRSVSGNNMTLKNMPTEIQKAFKDYRGEAPDFVYAVQEYANGLAGKSTGFDRNALTTKAGRKFLGGLRWLQSVAGQNKILGNVSSTFAQALNLPDTIRSNGLGNTVKGIVTALGGKETRRAMKQSDFLRARYTEAQGKYVTGKMGKVRNAVSTVSLMKTVEKAFVELSWSASYQKALRSGKRGFEAVMDADREAARTVADRGIAQMPEVYRSTLGKTFLQFTYEVNESGKNTVKSGVKGMAKYFVAALLVNQAFEWGTNRRPLPDPIHAALATARDMMNDDDDVNGKGEDLPNDFVQAGQRAAAELLNMSGVGAAMANTLPQGTRKNLFGSDSDFGRYAGDPAALATAGDVLSLPVNLLSGNNDDALKNVTNLVPVGSQVKKTVQGAQKAADNDSDNGGGVGDWARGLIFGKSAVGGNADDGDAASAMSPAQLATMKSLSEGGDYGKSSVSGENYKSALARRKASKDKDGSYKAEYEDSMDKLWDDRVIKLASGDYKLDGGVLKTKAGNVASDWYKAYARQATANGESGEHVYEAFARGYNFPSEGAKTRDLDGKYDVFDKSAGRSDVVSFAINLAKNSSEGYADIPDSIKQQFYAKNQIGTNGAYKYNPAGLADDFGNVSDLDYAVAASMDVATRYDNVARDIQKIETDGGSRDDMLRYLLAGRKKSIAGKQWVTGGTSGVLGQLRDAGVISKDEYNALNKISDINKDGQSVFSSTSGGSSGRKKSGGSSGKVAKLHVPDLDSLYLPSLGKLLKDYSTGAPDTPVVAGKVKNMAKGIKREKVNTDVAGTVKRLKGLAVR
jgi:hypothetical protein